jgi:16S rRNA (guanine966-N2)-methyltransferase
MRVIAGSLSGRYFSSPDNNHTHPMSEKIRGALFNSLGDISGLRLLDAFSGAGALSFEAISRDARYVLAIELDRISYKSILLTSKELKISLENLKVVRANCYSWSLNNPESEFDIIIADPPFPAVQQNPNQVFLLMPHLIKGGLFILSLPKGINSASGALRPPDEFKCVNFKNYGDAELVFYRRIR